MNFYRFIKQQYDNYNKNMYTIDTRCVECPCKTLRDKILGKRNTKDCSVEIKYLVDKYEIHDFNIFFCTDCRLASVEIAKKLFGKEDFNKI